MPLTKSQVKAMSRCSQNMLKRIEAIYKDQKLKNYTSISDKKEAINVAIKQLRNIELYAGSCAEGASSPEHEQFLRIEQMTHKAMHAIAQELYI